MVILLALALDSCILETTVLTSTVEELEQVNRLIVQSEYTSTHVTGTDTCVFFFNETRDTVVSREVSNGADETYRIFIKD